MRLDYILYVLAALLLIITVVPFVVAIEGVESDARSLWVVTGVVLGLLSIGLGYSQRPKTEAQSCQPAVATPQEMLPQTASAALEVRKEEMQAAPTKEVSVEKTSSVAVSAVVVMELTQVKGIGEKRALQLKALGINSVVDLSKASAQSVAKKLKISPKIVSKWIDSAKELVK